MMVTSTMTRNFVPLISRLQVRVLCASLSHSALPKQAHKAGLRLQDLCNQLA